MGRHCQLFTIDEIKLQELYFDKRQDIEFPNSVGKHKVEVQLNPERAIAEARYDNNTKIVEYEIVN